MRKLAYELADRLALQHTLTLEEYCTLLEQADAQVAAYLAALARKEQEKHYGNEVFLRGLIEVSNVCKNDCYYCGIRRSNHACQRYRLTEEEILTCCAEGYAQGFRTFVLQGGEDPAFSDQMLENLLMSIKSHWPDTSVVLSMGERSDASLARLRKAGADRYMLRYETADPVHYGQLHPGEMSWENRMSCLHTLRKQGYQIGCGFMVGTPGQTVELLAKELQFLEKFQPELCSIGPFIPHRDTPFGRERAGSAELTCLLLSCIRLIHPSVLLLAANALGALRSDGREAGVLAGANLMLPVLSPERAQNQYLLYNGKRSDGTEIARICAELDKRMHAIGYRVVPEQHRAQQNI